MEIKTVHNVVGKNAFKRILYLTLQPISNDKRRSKLFPSFFLYHVIYEKIIMNHSAIKTWNFKLGKYEKKLALFSDKFTLVNLHPVTMGAPSYSKPLGAFFTQDFPFYPVFEEFKNAVLDVYQPSKHCTQLELKHWDFWKHFDANKTPAIRFKTAVKKDYLTFFLEFDGYFIKKGYWLNDALKYNGKVRIDQFFFYGPSIPGFPLKERRKMRETLHKALNIKTNLSLSDAFPLFNYDKIPSKKWEHHHNNSSFDFIEMNQDRFSIGGAANPKDIGARTYSIEEVWFNSPHKNSSYFQEANKEIHSILKNAIIK